MFTQNTHFTNMISQFPMLCNRPYDINLKIVGNMPSLVLEKFMKFQHPRSSRFGDILEKPEGWMKTPPPLIGLTAHWKFAV